MNGKQIRRTSKRNGIAALGVWILAAAALAFGQAPATPPAQGPLTFDVATVKPSAPLDMAKIAQQMQAGQMPKIGPHVESSRAEYNYMTLLDMIALAFQSDITRISTFMFSNAVSNVLPPRQVGLHPALLSYDVTRANGINIGFNPDAAHLI